MQDAIATGAAEDGPCPPQAAPRARFAWRARCAALVARLRSWWSQSLFPAAGAETPAGGAFWGPLLLLAALAAALLFPRLSYPLVEPDEGRYAELAREMLDGGGWLVPLLHGKPYNDKPPLLHWLTASSLAVFGVHPWAARLVPTGAAFLTVLAVFLLGRRLVGARAGFLGALGLLLMAGFAHSGRFLIIDGVLTLFLTLALLTGYEAVRGPRLRWAWWVASAFCCGLGVLAKGPVALVLVAPPLAAFTWLNRPAAARLRFGHWAGYVGLMACVAVPWYVAVIVRDPDFAYEFFIEHHLARFFSKEYHDSPVWFYAPVLLGLCLPWSPLFWPLGRFLFSRVPEARARRRPWMGFALLWASWGLVFFSLSRGKLPTYILPTLPAVALLLGGYLDAVLAATAADRFFRVARERLPRWTAAGLCCAWLAGGAWGLSRDCVSPGEAVAATATLLLAAACLAALVVWGRRLSAAAAWGSCGALAFAVLLGSTQGLVPAWAARRSPLARWDEVAGVARTPGTGIALLGSEWSSVSFYLHGEGDSPADVKWPWPQLKEFLARHVRNLLVINEDTDEATVRRLVPLPLAITRRLPSGHASIVLVEGAAGHASP